MRYIEAQTQAAVSVRGINLGAANTTQANEHDLAAGLASSIALLDGMADSIVGLPVGCRRMVDA